MSIVEPQRTMAELKELRALTADDRGAQRVAFTETWVKARQWLKGKLAELPVEVHTDAAGNLWATFSGESEKELLIGGHIDSVPNGGWLDGCLNVLGGLEVLRRIAGGDVPPVTIRLVDWADEEGARFGRSLFGSSAASGTLRLDEVRGLTDGDGIGLPDALAAQGIQFEGILEAHQELRNAVAYLELHIEQGPVLESKGLPMGAVIGTMGVERHVIRFTGQAAHSGSTPMDKRRDAFLAAGKMSQEIYAIAERHQGVCTIGSCKTRPGIVTSVVGECEITLDQRHLDAQHLAAMWKEAQKAAAKFADEGNVGVMIGLLMQIQPILFHPELVDLADQAVRETCGVSFRLPSGPLHDACEMARAGLPTAMLFVQSLAGISHNRIEDTKEKHLEDSVVALDRLAGLTMEWLSGKGGE